ncbi:hypothetical protein BC629DRAFT_60912 [Irpex lacteus]|nr:hypothetical protein BC629DRAFT_60912 [Irpex lacteus]
MSMFPTELIDIIVDHLHDDWLALLQCALVCRTWTVSSRYHLFRKIKIPLSPSAGDTDLHMAVQAFESAMGSQCGSYVRMCTITTTGSFYGYWDVEPCVSLATLGRLVSLLPRLQTLWTVNVAWPAASIKGSPILASASVTSLIVCRVEASRDSKQQFKTVRDVMSVLCLLPALKTLATIRSCWEPQPLWDGIPTEEFPSFPAQLNLSS